MAEPEEGQRRTSKCRYYGLYDTGCSPADRKVIGNLVSVLSDENRVQSSLCKTITQGRLSLSGTLYPFFNYPEQSSGKVAG